MKNKKLNIYFYNNLCSNRVFDDLFKLHHVTSFNASQKFYSLLAEGLSKIENVNVQVTSLLPINFQKQKKRFWKSQKDVEHSINYETIPLLNIPIIRNVLASIYVFFKILFYKFPNNSQNVIFVDFLKFSINLSILLAAKLRGIKILTVVTDLPLKSVESNLFLLNLFKRLIFSFKGNFDYYVCLTKYIDDVINTKKKPSIVIEGFANIKLSDVHNVFQNKFDERVIIYAGGLYEEYGLKNMVEAFKLIPGDDLSLWFYGTGPFVDKIKDYQKNDQRIIYKGVLPNEELIDILMKATLLINPRPTSEEYTKYSFPSKNLEYMSTGTPLITTNLLGIPEDHIPYVYLFKSESISDMAIKLQSVLNNSREDIHSFGLSSKEYVMKEKNNVSQSEKIVNLILK